MTVPRFEKPPYYITAYGLAVKRGYKGTLDEWLASLQGTPGDAATLVSSAVEYLVSDSGTVIPSGSWTTTIPTVAQGKYLWTRTTQTYNTGDPIISYSISRMGLDGAGSVVTVNLVSPDADGNVALKAADIGAVATDGSSTMTGPLDIGSNRVKNVAEPEADTDAATLGYARKVGAPYNLLDNSDFRNPVNQRGSTIFQAPNIEYWLDRWVAYGTGSSFTLEEGKVVISSDGTATCGLVQRVSVNSLKAGSKYTLAFKAKVIGAKCYLSYGVNNKDNAASSAALEENFEKIHTFTFTLPEADADSACYNFRIRSSAAEATMEIEWAALYEGEYTAETLPEYQPKGYGAELAECMRYYYRIDFSWVILAPGTKRTNTTGRSVIYLPVHMRVFPTVNVPVTTNIVLVTTQGNINVAELEPFSRNNYFGFNITTERTIPDTAFSVYGNASRLYIELLADL